MECTYEHALQPFADTLDIKDFKRRTDYLGLQRLSVFQRSNLPAGSIEDYVQLLPFLSIDLSAGLKPTAGQFRKRIGDFMRARLLAFAATTHPYGGPTTLLALSRTSIFENKVLDVVFSFMTNNHPLNDPSRTHKRTFDELVDECSAIHSPSKRQCYPFSY